MNNIDTRSAYSTAKKLAYYATLALAPICAPIIPELICRAALDMAGKRIGHPTLLYYLFNIAFNAVPFLIAGVSLGANDGRYGDCSRRLKIAFVGACATIGMWSFVFASVYVNQTVYDGAGGADILSGCVILLAPFVSGALMLAVAKGPRMQNTTHSRDEGRSSRQLD